MRTGRGPPAGMARAAATARSSSTARRSRAGRGRRTPLASVDATALARPPSEEDDDDDAQRRHMVGASAGICGVAKWAWLETRGLGLD